MCIRDSIPGTTFPADTDKVYRALYDDLMKQADNKEMLPEKEIFSNVLTLSLIHIWEALATCIRV